MRKLLQNKLVVLALAGVAVLQVAVTHHGPMQRLFDTTSISIGQWIVCIAVASSVLWVEELRKWLSREPIDDCDRVRLDHMS